MGTFVTLLSAENWNDRIMLLLIGVLHGSSNQCEDEKTDAPSIFARVDHPEIFDFIKKTKHDLELCQELKDCFCELANVSC